MLPDAIKLKIKNSAVIAVVTIDDSSNAVPLAESLIKGGVTVMELTLRSESAMDSLRLIIEQVPEMTAGVGTVLRVDQLEEIIAVGAEFGVAPGLNPKIIQRAKNLGFPFAPGIVTPSDIELGVELGCNTLKFFPAEASGGLKYFKSMTAPYSYLKLQYIPLGGLNEDNFKSYLLDQSILAVGGSWIATRALINQQDWEQIMTNAQRAIKIANSLKGE